MKRSLVLPLSPTRLGRLRSCLKKVYYRYVEKRRGKKTPLLAEGLFIHDVAEHYRKYLVRSGGEHSEEVFQEIFDSLIKDHPDIINHYDIYWVAKNAAEFPFDVNFVVGVEIGIAVDLSCQVLTAPADTSQDDLAEVKAGYLEAVKKRKGFIAGKLDLCLYYPEDKLLDVRDIKSGYSKGYKPYQGLMYAFLGSCLVPEAEQVMVSMETPRVTSPDPITYTKDQIYSFIKDLEAEVNEYLQVKEFTANPGPACEYCDHRGVCDYVAPEYETLDSKEEAEEAYRSYLYHKAQANHYKDLCKAWAEETGANIVAGDKMLGTYPSSSEDVPADRLIEACQDLGIDLSKLSINKRSWTKLLKKNDALRQKLEPHIQISTKSRFSANQNVTPEAKEKWDAFEGG